MKGPHLVAMVAVVFATGCGGKTGPRGTPMTGGAPAIGGASGGQGGGPASTGGGAASTGGGAVSTGGVVSTGGGGAGGRGGSGDVGGSGGSLGGNGGGAAGAGSSAFCGAWTGDLAVQNQRALERHGLFESKAILEGTLGDRFDRSGQSYAYFKIGRVRAGVAFHAGKEIAIAMGSGLHTMFGGGASLVVGLSSTYPFSENATSLTTWDQPLAILRADQTTLFEDALGFRAWHAPTIVVVRVRELPPDRIAFDVLETLAGTPPAAFFANWSSSWGPLPLHVGDEFVAGFGEIMDIAGIKLATEMFELRPNNPDEHARALRGVAALGVGGFATQFRAAMGQARVDATNYRLAWTFGRSERVVGVEVAGRAEENSTNAGGTYFANTVTDVLRGAALNLPLVTGGHGVRSDDQCGDRFLLALRTLTPIAGGSLAGYNCTTPVGTVQAATSLIEARLPATSTNRDNVAVWLGSAPPLLRLYPSGTEAPLGAFDRPTGPMVLSVPVPVTTALQARHDLAVFTIVDARAQAGGGYAVRVRTPFYLRELPSLVNREAVMFFPCADPRLLEVGRRWIGAVMGSEPFFGQATGLGTQLDEQRVMLIPGVLIPEEREDLVRSAELLRSVLIARPLGP